MSFYKVDRLSFTIKEGNFSGHDWCSSPQVAIVNFLHQTASSIINKAILKHHYVFMRFVPGKYPEFDIKNRSLNENEMQKILDDGWCIYNGKKRKIVGFPLGRSVSHEESLPDQSITRNRSNSEPVSPKPPIILNVVNKRRSSTDASGNVGQFIEECIKIDKNLNIPNSVLYNRYNIWCITGRNMAETQEQFVEHMKKYNHQMSKINNIDTWKGICLS